MNEFPKESLTDDDLAAFEDKFGTGGRALSRLIRPAIAAPEGRTLFWGDWSAIEAGTLPWLADTPRANAVLDVIREANADPASKPDLYCREAAAIEGTALDEFWARFRAKDPVAKAARQTGKVAVLSLGFGGGVGALQAMAIGYGISLTAAEARVIVDKWRDNNPWARTYWNALWSAFLAAMDAPDTPFQVGRVVYLYDKSYHGGSMFCFLPDGRPLIYPRLRWVEVEREDDRGNAVTKTELTYDRGYSRRSLWYGVLAENNTQGTAGSLLREKLVDLCPAPALKYAKDQPPAALLSAPAQVIGHTHDEIIGETDDNEEAVAKATAELHASMVAPTAWSEGLPLAAEVSTNWYYSKVIG